MSGDLKITSKGALGALVEGVDLAQVTPQQMVELEQAYADHEVLFFENQNLAPEAHLAFAERWGDQRKSLFRARSRPSRHRSGGERARSTRQHWRLLAYGSFLRSSARTGVYAVSQRSTANGWRYFVRLLHSGVFHVV